MLIDWFTVGAQLINFIVLVWLLKRFLYHPILDAIDAREAKVKARLDDASALQAEARTERATFERKHAELEHERAERLASARSEAEAERQRLIEAAREAALQLRTKSHEALERERQGLNDIIMRQARREMFSLAHKTLADLADTSLEERMVEVFTTRLRALDVQTSSDLEAALKASPETVVVLSAFELSTVQRAALRDALGEAATGALQLRYEVAPELVSGIELHVGGRKLAWTIRDHLKGLEARVEELLGASKTAFQ